jgi:hypothetical protein
VNRFAIAALAFIHRKFGPKAGQAPPCRTNVDGSKNRLIDIGRSLSSLPTACQRGLACHARVHDYVA